jgi:addiction module HigA family antidote
MTRKNGLPAIHPGTFLQEALAEMGVSQAELARQIGVSAMRISHVVKGQRPVTAELALLFGRAFGQSPEYWLNLQTGYDLKIAEKALRRRLTSLRPLTIVS